MLGFVLRQQLVQEVRNEYESIVGGIQSQELLQKLPLPLDNEAIKWPHENMLCFPLFVSQKRESPCEPCRGDQDEHTLHFTHHSESCDQKSGDLNSQYRAEDVPISTTKLSPRLVRSEVGSGTGDIRQDDGDNNEQLLREEVDICLLECLIEPLPSDREALLELRSQLNLELLWVKQAIASRQEVSFKFYILSKLLMSTQILLQYLRLRRKLQTEHPPTN